MEDVGGGEVGRECGDYFGMPAIVQLGRFAEEEAVVEGWLGFYGVIKKVGIGKC